MPILDPCAAQSGLPLHMGITAIRRAPLLQRVSDVLDGMNGKVKVSMYVNCGRYAEDQSHAYAQDHAQGRTGSAADALLCCGRRPGQTRV